MTVSVEYLTTKIEYPDEDSRPVAEGNYFPIQANTLADGSVSIISELLGLELRLEFRNIRFYSSGSKG